MPLRVVYGRRRDSWTNAARTCPYGGRILVSPYTGTRISFLRGQSTSTAGQIDHVVALSDAWQKGGQRLSPASRTAFANDPLNLLAVDGPTNEAKGDGDAATWLPPMKSYRCAYVARQVAVKDKYGLWVTTAEHDAIARILQSWPKQKLPTSKAISLGGGTVRTAPATPKSSSSPQLTKPSSGLDPRFDTCKAAKAAGYGPYYAGKDPE
ncbi:HNH endonuclease family protein [Intrasporangium oryzae]|uniref:HNH endonuclease family protein n=1 Tax=Intrasporangium oryzae TaxID=412687 RepID=UPI0026D6CAC8|nr:HNH endonuclease family protein [Intrasporangium oryzae]